MYCVNCGEKTIWQNDFDFNDYLLEGDGIVTIYSCPNCGIFYEIVCYFEEEEETIIKIVNNN